MQKEFGGYLPLELPDGKEYIDRYAGVQVLRLNCGRNAIAAALLGVKAKKVYIPHYNCDVVRETVEKYEIPFEKYLLDDKMQPSGVTLDEQEWLLYPNYFGALTESEAEAIADRFGRVIFDNTQAFFAPPVRRAGCFNVYSPRKFIGLIDGAYLIWDNDVRIDDSIYRQDVSWERGAFLLKSQELGTNAAYQDNMQSKTQLGDEILRMSVLTRKMLSGADYDRIRCARRRNLSVLKKHLDPVNQLPFSVDGDLMNYPLYIENDALRAKLVSQKIYVPQWWKYVIPLTPADSVENRLSRWLLPLPIDQRYSEADMETLAEMVLNAYESC